MTSRWGCLGRRFPSFVRGPSSLVLRFPLFAVRLPCAPCLPRLGTKDEAVSAAFLPKTRDYGWDFLFVGCELLAEGFAEQTFFYVDADVGADQENGAGERQRRPWGDDQTGGYKHSQHSGVDGIADIAIGAILNEVVIFDNAGG